MPGASITPVGVRRTGHIEQIERAATDQIGGIGGDAQARVLGPRGVTGRVVGIPRDRHAVAVVLDHVGKHHPTHAAEANYPNLQGGHKISYGERPIRRRRQLLGLVADQYFPLRLRMT